MKRRCFLIVWLIICITKSVMSQTPASVVPDFTFFKLDGTPFLTKQIPSGKPSLFSFFDVTCSHCKVTMRLLSKHYPELKGISVFLITLDRKDAIIKFMNSYGPAFLNKKNVLILQDLKYEFIPKFQPLKYPSVFLYNRYKKLEMYEQDEKKMLKVIAKVKSIK